MQLSAGAIALLIAMLLLLVALVAYASGVGKRAHQPVEGVPTGNPSMERKVAVTLALMLLSGLALTAYAFWEPIRQAAAAERQENVSIVRGIDNYTTLCVGCHGVDGLGAVVPGTDPPRVAPQLNREDLRPKDPDEYKKAYELVYKTIQRGRPGTPMPAWGRQDGGSLLDEQIHELALMITKGDKHVQGEETVWEVVREEAREKIAHGAPEPQKPEVQLAAELSEDAKAGARLLQSKGCIGCHVIGGGVGGQTGPNLTQVAAAAASRKPGTSAEEYIRESILQPQAFLVPGYPPVMPSFQGQLSDQELNQIVEYLLAPNK
jgi:mono/diheme cytochrome c family protein